MLITSEEHRYTEPCLQQAGQKVQTYVRLGLVERSIRSLQAIRVRDLDRDSIVWGFGALRVCKKGLVDGYVSNELSDSLGLREK
jgi:hypothetical protein